MMTKLQWILMALLALFGRLFALPASAARRSYNNGGNSAFKVLRTLGVFFLATAMTACTNDTKHFSILGFVEILLWIIPLMFFASIFWEHWEEDKWTSLHSEAKSGKTEAALALIKAGANINAKDKSGWTPLHSAILNGQTETALALIKAGANIDAKNGDGWTPLHSAILYGQTKIVLVLIRAGAAIDAKTGYGWTPLHCAASKGQTETALAFVKAGASLFIRDRRGQTPLDVAIEMHGKDSEIARVLRAAMAKRGD